MYHRLRKQKGGIQVPFDSLLAIVTHKEVLIRRDGYFFVQHLFV